MGHQAIDKLWVKIEVLKHLTRVAADQHSKQVAPIPAQYRIKLFAVNSVEEAEEHFEEFVLVFALLR